MSADTMWKNLAEAERQEIFNRWLNGEDPTALSEECGVPRYTLLRRLQEIRKDQLDSVRRITPVGGDQSVEAHLKLFYNLVGRNPARKLAKPTRRRDASKTRRIVVMCDIHGSPNKEIVGQVYALGPDEIILAGDVFDAFSLSVFPKDRDIPITEELAEIRAMLEALSPLNVTMISGNHDDRAKKYFANNIPAAFLPLVQYNLLEMVSLGLPHVKVEKNKYNFGSVRGYTLPGELENDWICHRGDAFIAHAEVAKKGELRTVDALVEWVDKWRRSLNWPDPTLVVQAHVHRAGQGWARGGQQVRIEGGYCGSIDRLQYAMNFGSTKYDPPAPGFVLFDQYLGELDQWKTDVASARFIPC